MIQDTWMVRGWDHVQSLRDACPLETRPQCWACILVKWLKHLGSPSWAVFLPPRKSQSPSDPSDFSFALKHPALFSLRFIYEPSQCCLPFFFSFFSYLLTKPWDTRDLSSPTGDQTRTPLQWKWGALITGAPGKSLCPSSLPPQGFPQAFSGQFSVPETSQGVLVGFIRFLLCGFRTFTWVNCQDQEERRRDTAWRGRKCQGQLSPGLILRDPPGEGLIGDHWLCDAREATPAMGKLPGAHHPMADVLSTFSLPFLISSGVKALKMLPSLRAQIRVFKPTTHSPPPHPQGLMTTMPHLTSRCPPT